MSLPTTNLFFVPSSDPTAMGKRLAAAAREYPLVNDTGMGMPVVLRKAHINAILRDPVTFSTRMFQAGILKGGLASLQGEDHSRMRRIYNMFFLPRAVERYEATIVRPIAEEVVSRLEGKESVDLLDTFAMEFPRRVISKLFGFPMEQISDNDERVRTMFRGIIRVTDPVAQVESQRAYQETLGQITEVVEREMAHRTDSLLGEILRTLEAENMATLEACQQIVLSLLLGGYETTSWLLANAIHAFLNVPGALDRIRREPAILPPAIEESMRWCPSVAGTLRLVERDVELEGGVKLPAGAPVYLATSGTHYDEEAYPQPEAFNIDRQPPPNPMVFGGGPHYCVGAPLGRMEARVGLSLLIERFPHMRPAPGENLTFTYGVRESVAHGPDRLPTLLQ